jgi:hypothetical protein
MPRQQQQIALIPGYKIIGLTTLGQLQQEIIVGVWRPSHGGQLADNLRKEREFIDQPARLRTVYKSPQLGLGQGCLQLASCSELLRSVNLPSIHAA